MEQWRFGAPPEVVATEGSVTKRAHPHASDGSPRKRCDRLEWHRCRSVVVGVIVFVVAEGENRGVVLVVAVPSEHRSVCLLHEPQQRPRKGTGNKTQERRLKETESKWCGGANGGLGSWRAVAMGVGTGIPPSFHWRTGGRIIPSVSDRSPLTGKSDRGPVRRSRCGLSRSLKRQLH